ncbi:MAG: hypothetical protein ACYCQJ_13015 [Nitrososphaerales archaeon]
MKSKMIGMVLLVVGLLIFGFGAIKTAQAFTVVYSVAPTAISGAAALPSCSSATDVLSSSAANYFAPCANGWVFVYYWNSQSGLTYKDESLYCSGSFSCTPNTAFITNVQSGDALSPSMVLSSETPYVFDFKVCDSVGTCSSYAVDFEIINPGQIVYNAYLIAGSQKTLINCYPCASSFTVPGNVTVSDSASISFEMDIAPSMVAQVQSIEIVCSVYSGTGSSAACPFTTNTLTQSSSNSSVFTISIGTLAPGAYTFAGDLNAIAGAGSVQDFAFSATLGVSPGISLPPKMIDASMDIIGIVMMALGVIFLKSGKRGIRL